MRFHIFHSWTKWTVVRQGEVCDSKDDVVGYFYVQQRTCSVCGFVQRRIEEKYIGD